MDPRWIVSSYLSMGGGFVAGLSLAGLIGASNFWVVLIFLALGMFGSGFLLAFASPGETIKEPAVGAAVFVLSLLGFFYATPVGELVIRLFFALDGSSSLMYILIVVAACFGGGYGGAVVGERIQESEDPSGAVFIGQSIMSILGGVFLGFFILFMVIFSGSSMTSDDSALAMLAAVSLGALVGGLGARMAGASGGQTALGALGAGAFFTALLMGSGAPDKALIGGVVIAVIMLISAPIGGLIGKQFAEEVE